MKQIQNIQTLIQSLTMWMNSLCAPVSMVIGFNSEYRHDKTIHGYNIN